VSHTLDRPRAARACCDLATYMRAAKLEGVASVIDEDSGYCLGCTLAAISPEALELVPPKLDGLTVRVLI
jgi:hypothetical protein